MELNSANGIFHIWNELMTIIHSKKQWITVLVVFAILLGVRFYYIGQKRSMYIDEGLSISICNRNESGFWRNGYQYNHEYTGKELKEISLWDDASVRDALSDVYHLHQSNWDTPHTNFYYSLFRLWFTGVKTYNLKLARMPFECVIFCDLFLFHDAPYTALYRQLGHSGIMSSNRVY